MTRWVSRAAIAAMALVPALVATAPEIAAQPAPDGATIFRQRCQTCHSVDPARPSRIGPMLNGVVGRKAASTTFNYSRALKASNLTWTPANLDRYLSGPARMVPGTRMTVILSDPAQRAALVRFLGQRR